MSGQARTQGEVGDTGSPTTIPVWDVFVRMFHWSLVTTFVVAWITADDWDRLHEWAGYFAVALVAGRIVWGFIGTRYARFADFVKSPVVVLRYLADILRGREQRHVGHNPAGGAMVIALLVCILGLGLTGWMMTTDTFWGVEWVEGLHETLANGMLFLVGLHILGVLIASMRHRENLIFSMFTGRKPFER